MAQKPFLMDKGIQVGDWYFTQNTDGDLKLSSTAEAGVSQRPFRVDHGFKIGTMAWFETGENFKASEDDSGLTQRPFLADAGIQVGDWVITQNTDYDVTISVGGSVLSGLYSSTAISSGTVAVYSGVTISGLDTANVDGTVATAYPGVMTFSTDGTYVFIQDDQTVYRAELSTAWDITSAGSFTQVFVFGTSGAELSEGCHFWSYDGMYFYQIVQYTAGDTELVIHRHSVGTAYDMTTWVGGSYDQELRISHSSIQTVLDANSVTGVQPQDFTRLKFSFGGTKIILMSHSGHFIEFSTLSSWSASRSGSISYGSLSGYVEYLDVSFNFTGTKCWVTARDGSGNVYIVEYYMATPWDWSSLTYNTQWDLGSFTGLPLGIWYYNGKLYFGGTDLNGTGVDFITSISLLGAPVSTAPAAPTYTITITDSNGDQVTTVNEGSEYTLTVTTNAPDGTVIWFHLVEDIAANYTDPVTIDWLLNGTQSIAETATVTDGTATKTLSIIADNRTETGYEKFKVYVSTTETFATIAEYYQASTPWVTINDTSQTPLGAADYNWTVTTSFDTNDPNAYYLSTSNLGGTYGQIEEGAAAGTWTITTDAPDGTQVFTVIVSAWLGTYDYANDPTAGMSEWTYPNYPQYGYKTVANGQISGSWQALNDGFAENGEVVRLSVRANSGYASQLVTTEWFEIVDSGQATNTPWSAPSAGESFTGGEGYWESGVSHGYWYTASGSSTGNPRVTIRIENTWDYDLRRDIEYALQQMQVGDSFLIGTTSMTVTGNITSGPDSNPDYTLYSFDVNAAPNTANPYVFFYEFTITV